MSTVSPHGSGLDEWRNKASFDVREMQYILGGGEERVKIKDEILSTLEKDPLFQKEYRVYTVDEYRELTHKRWKRLIEYNFAGNGDFESSRALSECLEIFDQGVSSRLLLHDAMFVNVLRSMGTDRHKKIIEMGEKNQIVGCFCLTELTHGSNSGGIQTTATFDKGEFVLHTPTEAAMKVWSGNLALSATHAIVYAQLYIGDKCEGPHAFVLQVRDVKTYKVLPGIRIGDMGAKPGQWNAVENGWMVFEHHRAPLWTLLNKGCDVTADGRYVHEFKSIGDKKAVSLGALSFGRVGIIGKGVLSLCWAATIGIRYSAVRRQFGPENGEELAVLSYPLQRRRLLPALASAVCIRFFHNHFLELFMEYMMRVLSGERTDELAEMSKEVHALSSATKPRSTGLGLAALAEARAACGGHGFLFCSRLNELRDSFDPTQTFEGENNILIQQTSNYLIKQSEEGITSSPMSTCDFLKRKPTTYQGWKQGGATRNVEEAYEWLMLYLLAKTKKELEEKKRQGKDMFTARNEVQLDAAHPLAIAYADWCMIKWAREGVEGLEDEKCKRVLANCVDLFALSILQQQNHLATLYIGGYCSGSEFGTRVREEQIAAEDRLYPDAVALVDAVAPPDFALHSALGASDGRPYEHLVEEFYRHEGKRATFTEDLSAFLQSKAKLSQQSKEDSTIKMTSVSVMPRDDVADIAVIGLAVMGQNLILNMNDHGFTVCAFNRTTSKVDEFLASEAKGTKIVGAHSVEEMCKKLKRPRRIMLLVKAGAAVEQTIASIVPHLEKGDIIIDGGNSEYTDSNRRTKELAAKGILFVGCGVSGGEEGARYGPSLMPGGNPEAWPHLKHIFQSIAAKSDGEPCCDWVGEAGAGHFVKMVHNGIEYGDMQLIAEAYHLLTKAVGLNHDQMADVMNEWNKGELDSFLIEITANILKYKDGDGQPIVPKIRDAAGQKGTGKWTCFASLEYGIPVTLIGEAVFARCLSALKNERVKAAAVLPRPTVSPDALIKDKKEFITDIRKALYASKIVSYAQGFMLLAEASNQFKWNLNFGAIALMWRGGCIIRSRFLGNIKKAFDKNPTLSNLLLDDFFRNAVGDAQQSWRTAVSVAVLLGIPVPAFSTALSFYDGYTSDVLPANLIQAQRDYFGAHTYELLSKPGEWVHTNWTGKGGRVTSNAYSA